MSPVSRARPLRAAVAAACLLLTLSLAACDSGGDGPEPSEVAGVYQFDRLVFDITAPNFPDVVVTDTLQYADLILRSSGLFTLEYQFEGADDDVVAAGEFNVSEDRVRLRVDEDDAPFLEDLLMPAELSLRREEGDVLTADVRRSLNLEEFNRDRYPGLTGVAGTLRVRLVD